jgi:crotonobetaine/carnitine-CoA ligase
MRYQRTIRELLDYRVKHTPDFIFARHQDGKISFRALGACVNRLANGLTATGIVPGKSVAVMLANHPDHIFTFFAIASLGAVWVPINTNLRGRSLEYIFEQNRPDAIIIDNEFWDRVEPVVTDKEKAIIIVRNASMLATSKNVLDFATVANADPKPPSTKPILDSLRCVAFTSGTTGPPKGVLMTERMLRACATGAAIVSEVRPQDIYLFWEPIYHNSGAQMCILALMESITLVVVPRFSASRFWDIIKKNKVTKIHYLGGIIDILLKQPPRADDKNHGVRIAFGGGCRKESWREFEQRFGVTIRECYGLTEASGFTTVNTSGKVGSIGKPYPYFDVQIVDDDGLPLKAGLSGEILVREKEPGLITQGYLKNPEATAAALQGGWLHTGDLGRYDTEGDFYYLGRKKDSIRRRGENISAWEVESVLNSHPDITESAVIGVDAEIGEQELKAFIVCAAATPVHPLAIIKWCEPRMPYFQIPRYVTFVDGFQKTPTERIRKETLSHDTKDCWDLEKSGYRIRKDLKP